MAGGPVRLHHTIVLLIGINLSFGQVLAGAADSPTKAGSTVNRSGNRPGPNAPLAEQLASLYSLAETDQKRALESLEGLLEDPRFPAQGSDLRHDAYSLSAWLEIQAKDLKKALASTRSSIDADPEVIWDWYALATLEYNVGNREASANALTHLVQHWPEKMEIIDAALVSQLIYQSKLEFTVRLDLLQALTHADWKQGRSQNSGLWYELTLAQLLAGNVRQARESAQRVSAPDFIVKLRSDKQFDPLIDRNAPAFDVALAARSQVEALQRLAGTAPDSLELRNELNDAMLTAGMTEAALRHADLILAKMSQMSAEDPQFADMDARIWTMNNRAVALNRLDRADEAIQQLEIASALEENGHPNVSQILNLAQAYCSRGQPQKARETLARLGRSLSPYGEMVKASTEHRIAVQTHDEVAAREALDHLRENRSFSQSIYLWALVEANQLDKAAELVKSLLASPADRSEALGWAQESLEAPQQPADVIPEANLKAVLARPDVQSAISAVGHVEHHPIFLGYMGH